MVHRDHAVCVCQGEDQRAVFSESSNWKVVPICLRCLHIRSRKPGQSLHLTPTPPAHLQSHPRGRAAKPQTKMIMSCFPPASMVPSRLWSWVPCSPTMLGVAPWYVLCYPFCRGSCHCLCRKTRLGVWLSLASGVDRDVGIRPYSVDPPSSSAFQGFEWVLTHWLIAMKGMACYIPKHICPDASGL